MLTDDYQLGQERGLLGAMLQGYQCDAHPDLFTFDDTRQLSQLLPANPIQLAAKYPALRQLIAECLTACFTIANAPYYLEALMTLHQQRQMAALAEAIQQGATPDEVEQMLANIQPATALTPTKLHIPDDLPKREFLYGVHMARQFTSMTVAPAGAGKTTVSVMDMLSVATGRGMIGTHVHEQAAVWYYNLEDPLDEMKRRIWAACRHHQIDVPDNIYLDSGRDRRLMIMEKSGNTEYAYPDKAALTKAIKKNNIGLLIVDPFISSYEGDENNNKDVDRAIKAFNQVASDTNSAIELIHHTGKGQQEGANAGRGASAMVGAVRSLRTIVKMTEDEAERFGLPSHIGYIRIDDGKVSMGPESDEHAWMHLESHELPNGDSVGVLSQWTPPGLFDKFSREDLNAALEAVQRGRDNGYKYHFSAAGASKNGAWVGIPIGEALGCDDATTGQIIAAWKENGVLFDETYLKKNGERVKGVGAKLLR